MARADVDVTNVVRTWVPANVTIQAGEAVPWTWTSLHNVAQVNGPAANSWNGTGFYSGAAGNGGAFNQTFATPGVYYYVCELHAAMGMRGTVTVTDPCADPTPPPTTLHIAFLTGPGTILLTWDPVELSQEGCPLSPLYRVLGGPSSQELVEVTLTPDLFPELPAVGRACYEVQVLPAAPAR